MDAASPGPASASPAAGAAAGTPDGVKRTPSVKERFAANAGVKMKPRRKGVWDGGDGSGGEEGEEGE